MILCFELKPGFFGRQGSCRCKFGGGARLGGVGGCGAGLGGNAAALATGNLAMAKSSVAAGVEASSTHRLCCRRAG